MGLYNGKGNMMEFIDLVSMAFNYDERVVDNFRNDLFTIDTVLVTFLAKDRTLPYETAVLHKNFNDGKWIVLEGAETKEKAQETHNKWVEYFLNNDVQEIQDSYTMETFKKI